MTDEELTGPECDWCGAEPGPRNDLDVYGVGEWFVCGECLSVARAGPQLLAACRYLEDYWKKGIAVDGGGEVADMVRSAITFAEGGDA